MLQPTNRLTLIDSMRPPSGFGLESAMAVTFTLDLRALLAAPAAFALSGADGLTDDGSQYEPIELLHALRSHAGKLTVFSQVGEIALPPSRRVFAFLERSVIPVRAPLGGVVHPKVWVLRYETVREGAPERRLRVLSASRNLTFDASWDTVVRLDESAGGSGADLGPLGELFEGLISNAGPVSAEHKDRVTSLVAALHDARFALPQGVDELRVNVMGLTRTPSPLPVEVDRSLIISPFLGDDFFTSGRPAPVDELVSRPESLDLLGTTALGHVDCAYAFDDGSSADLDAAQERLTPRDPGRPIVGVHAKVFAFEDAGRARLFLGSANATGAAFTSNVEVLIELVGSVQNLGIDRLCEGTGDEPGLRSLFNTYARLEPAAGDEPETPALDGARHAIARLAIEGFVEESGTGWAVTYRSAEAMPAVDAVAIHCWPLASAGNRREVPAGEPLDVRFETTIETISGFLAFEAADDSGRLTQFVVPVPLHDVPEQRERLLLRALVGNAERFLRYVLALLDEDPTQMDFLDALDAAGTEGTTDGVGALSLPVLEKLLRTMRRDPAKLAGLHPLVSDLAADDALPPGFAELWETIYDVALTGGASR
jgi:hypothetical protein